MSTTVIQISSGAVRGALDDGVRRFLSVPYAAPPVGENRFKEAEPVRQWSGERDATKSGPTSWYKSPVFPGLDIEPLIGPGGTGGDDYLTVNVWTPVGATDRPVMVWIHGGAFVLGSKDSPSDITQTHDRTLAVLLDDQVLEFFRSIQTSKRPNSQLR